jgi:hypothetical protein
MIKKHSLVWLVALFFFSAFFTAAQASDDDCNDNITRGTELHQKIILAATAAAPAGAIGKADLEVENEHGVSRSEFEIETKGLLPGDYTVTTTNKSGSDSYVLGTISVAAELHESYGAQRTSKNKEFDFDDNETENDDCGDNHTTEIEDDFDDCGDNHTTEIEDDFDDCGDNHTTEHEDDFDCKDNSTESENNFTLPEGLALTDLGAISIADANSIEVLKGSFDNSTNQSQKRFSSRASLTPGIAGPDVSGKAFIHAINMKNKQFGRFFLVARKAPANTTLHITVNGNGVGTIQSNKMGLVILHRLPWVNLATVKSIVAADPNGKMVFSANF